MRVALVCPYDLTIPGGVQTQVVGLAGALRRRGHDVDIVAPGRPPRPGAFSSAGRSLPIPVNGSIAPMAPHPAAAWRTVQRLRRLDLDVVHLHEPLAPSITIPALLAHPAPVVGTFHAAGDRTPYRWLDRPLRRLARRIDVRVAVSEAAADLARRHLGGTYEVVGNGIDLAAFASPPATARDGRAVLFLGRHEPRKGLEVLLDAVHLLPPDVEVWVAGEGPDTGRLRGRHPDRHVRWLGRLSEDEKRCRLRSATVVCVPSLHGESFGVVLLEAMAAGTPVVASDVAGYRALAGGGKAALLVPPVDPAALGAALTEVLCDRVVAGALRAAGREVARRHTIDAVAARYVALYERLV